MIGFRGNMKVYVCTDAVDLRKSFGGLYAIAHTIMKEVPEDGGIFVFCNRARNRVKILCFDDTGCWVSTKRLDQGTFSWPKGVDVQLGKLELRPEALTLLLDGVDMRGANIRPWYQRQFFHKRRFFW